MTTEGLTEGQQQKATEGLAIVLVVLGISLVAVVVTSVYDYLQHELKEFLK